MLFIKPRFNKLTYYIHGNRFPIVEDSKLITFYFLFHSGKDTSLLNVAASTKIGLHISLKPLWKPPHRHTQRLVSLIVQDEFQLTVMITHHRRGVESWHGVRSGFE